MIELEALTKHFDTIVAVNNINLTVQAGEVLALLGPNGAGKTTTVRMLSAVLKPTSGHARVAGYDAATHARTVRAHVGVLTEAPGLYTRMSGREYLDFFGDLRGMGVAHRRERIKFLADWFKMTDALDRRLGEYSKGMAQKIALIRTLMHDPPVLLLDEPTSAMDPESARLVRDAILQMRDDERRAIILCTHNLPEAEELADRMAIIRHGEIIECGAPAALKSRLLGPPLMELRFAAEPQNGLLTLVERTLAAQGAAVQESGASWVRYRTTTPHVTNPMLLQALAGVQASVLTLSEVTQSLESVYLRVISEDETA